MLNKLIRFCLENKLVVSLVVLFVIIWGILVAPFDWKIGELPRNPVAVDAIPDIGENQQIVFTKWMGRSPQDIEDQISYPLTTALLGMPGVKTIRSYSFFGFSSIYIVFKENIEFYWSRSRVLEKLNSLPVGTLPPGVQPTLGPDATALGQVFWYTLEGQDTDGNSTGGWDLHELRSIQDWYVRYSLQSVTGIAEVASIGGFIQEYQIDVNPDAMRAHNVNLNEIYKAVKMSNLDVGAKTIEINKVEYIIRAKGFIKNISDIEKTIVKVTNNVPIYIKNLANVQLGPASRRGALDRGGSEAVGGVAVVRHGENPLAAIKNLKKKIKEISSGLPKKVLEDGTVSKVKIVPFYDRSGLIYETLGTLNSALTEEMLVTIIVVLIMVLHFRSSILISGLLPISILMCFIAMKSFNVDANIVALSGIAIAIGTMVDMGIVLCENILQHLEQAKKDANKLEIIYQASIEVGSAIFTAIMTTIVSFLPVFTMEAAEGKLFKPLAFTKTFALVSSAIVALTMIPPMAHILFSDKIKSIIFRKISKLFLPMLAVFVGIKLSWISGFIILLIGLYFIIKPFISSAITHKISIFFNYFISLVVAVILAKHWSPLGPEKGVLNIIFVIMIIGGILGIFSIFQKFYAEMLKWCLENKTLFFIIPLITILFGSLAWLGVEKFFFFTPKSIKNTEFWTQTKKLFPGLGKEFMPALDEGSYLLMPTTMPHASIGEAMDVLQKQDMAIREIPEIENVVGKIGRVDSPLDPAPISMVETIISYKPKYKLDKNGHIINYKYDKKRKLFIKDEKGHFIPDKKGHPYRQWRSHIQKPDDIWKEIVEAASIPGTTSAPKLQPIAARIVMLQSGMRAPMGVKIYGPDQKTIEKVGFEIEKLLKEVHSVQPNTVIADRIIGKPYLEIDINRDKISRYGLHIKNIQNIIEVAIGGKKITSTIEGRERYPVRVRYPRELRDDIENIEQILIPAKGAVQIPLKQLAKIKYTPGPMVIKSEDTFLVGYVVFDKKPEYAEVDVVEDCLKYLNQKKADGEFNIPSSVNFKFSGSYENQIRSEKKLMLILPLALFVIFIILYFQFKSISTTFLVFSGVFVAWAGGFIMIWFYGQDWFLNFSIFGVNFRELFQVQPFNLSVAVWVGFLALFGIATDNGVILATYLNQTFTEEKPDSIKKVHESTITASIRRIRPCLMTAGTTILALIPVLTSTGRGSDVMIPMAIPSFGGMTVVLISVFVVPVLYAFIEEWKIKYKRRKL